MMIEVLPRRQANPPTPSIQTATGATGRNTSPRPAAKTPENIKMAATA